MYDAWTARYKPQAERTQLAKPSPTEIANAHESVFVCVCERASVITSASERLQVWLCECACKWTESICVHWVKRFFSARLQLAGDGRDFPSAPRSSTRRCRSSARVWLVWLDCVWRVYLLIIRDTTARQNLIQLQSRSTN